MVLMSIEQYSALTDGLEMRLDEADRAAAENPVRLTGEEVLKKT